MFCIEAQKTNDIPHIEVMLDESFGVDRHSKTAYRLRDGISAVEELSFVIRVDGVLKATLQFWPIIIDDQSQTYHALLLGPIAVSDDCRGQGMGLQLMKYGLERAKDLGHERVILVGDEAYYKKVGFSRALAKGLKMPGPVDMTRLLAQELTPNAMQGIKGLISKIKL